MKKDEDGTEYGLVFYADSKNVGIQFIDDEEYKEFIPTFDMQDLKAINIKCKELGWEV